MKREELPPPPSFEEFAAGSGIEVPSDEELEQVGGSVILAGVIVREVCTGADCEWVRDGY